MSRFPQRVLTRWALAASIAWGLGCEPPDVSEYAPRTGVISGTLIYPNGTARGRTFIFLFAADTPPPPQGTGRPVNFIAVSEAALFGDAPPGAPLDFSAPFVIPTVPPGNYVLTALLDADGDFNPFVDLLNQPTAGDVVGGYVDGVTHAFRVVEVRENEAVDRGVLVALGSTVALERPAFAITATGTWSRRHMTETQNPQIDVPLAEPARLRIVAHAVRGQAVEMNPLRIGFLVTHADDDRNQIPDDQNQDHLADVYPKVVLKRQGTLPQEGTTIVPLVIDPSPYWRALSTRGATITSTLDLIVPTYALFTIDGKSEVVPLSPGNYDTIVISKSGQTWQVPNNLHAVESSLTDETQSTVVTFRAGRPLPSGVISGSVVVPGGALSDTFVFAFLASNPPPPRGTGRPVAAAFVPKFAFSDATGGAKKASFRVGNLATGKYILSGVSDTNHNLSLLSPFWSEPDQGDRVGTSTQSFQVLDGSETLAASLVLPTIVPFDRPAGILVESGNLGRQGFQTLTLLPHSVGPLGIRAEEQRFSVARAPTSAQAITPGALSPSVFLARIDETDNPRLAPEIRPATIIPAWIDPLPFVTTLARGAPTVGANSLRVYVPPFAVVRSGPESPPTRIPIPPGAYRLHLVNAFGQSWSLPNALDFAFGLDQTPDADPSQGKPIVVRSDSIGAGSIAGSVVAPTEFVSTATQIFIAAFLVDDPPPPAGWGAPRAATTVSAMDFTVDTATSARGSFVLTGLNDGRYAILAFIDTDQNLLPWLSTHAGPTGGDIPGGFFSGSTLGVVSVERGHPDLEPVVTFLRDEAFAYDRPVFSISTVTATLSRQAGSSLVRLVSVRSQSPALSADGTFVVQWIDVDQDGVADDVTLDNQEDVYPFVVAEKIVTNESGDLVASEPRTILLGDVSPAQFEGFGFPSNDPTATDVVVTTASIRVVFRPNAFVLGATPRRIPAPAGRYRIHVIGPGGQTWAVPNELMRAEGDPLAVHQDGALWVTE